MRKDFLSEQQSCVLFTLLGARTGCTFFQLLGATNIQEHKSRARKSKCWEGETVDKVKKTNKKNVSVFFSQDQKSINSGDRKSKCQWKILYLDRTYLPTSSKTSTLGKFETTTS